MLVSDFVSGELKLSVATVATVEVDDSVLTGRGAEGGGGTSGMLRDCVMVMVVGGEGAREGGSGSRLCFSLMERTRF